MHRRRSAANLQSRKTGVKVRTERYLRSLDEMKSVFKRERMSRMNEGCLWQKTAGAKTFEKFYLELSALPGQCDFTNAGQNIQDVFIMKMRETDCQRELSQSTKTPEEVNHIALSYEKGKRMYIVSAAYYYLTGSSRQHQKRSVIFPTPWARRPRRHTRGELSS